MSVINSRDVGVDDLGCFIVHAIFVLASVFMVSVCTFIGILGLDDGVQFMPVDKKHYW